MELRDYLHLLRRRWQSILVVALSTLAITALVTFVPTPQYTATTQLFFGVPGGESVNDLAQGSTFTEKQMSSYARVATSPLVLAPVTKQLGLTATSAELAQRVSATAPIDTVILEIAVTDPDPDQAARIANAVGKQLSAVVGDLVPQREGVQSVRATIFAEALPPSVPSTPRVALNLAVGSALALALGIGLAVLRHLLNSKIRSVQDVSAITDCAILSAVPFDASTKGKLVVMRDDPAGLRSEAMRRLRANLKFIDLANHVKSIVITSSIPEEGKTTTTVNLAVAMADAGLRVVVVDADLRRGSMADDLALEGVPGLTNVLIGGAQLTDAVQIWGKGLYLLPAGELPPNPSELLDSPAMSAVVKQLSSQYDMVLLDSPPLLPVSDALVLSKSAGGTLLVVGADRIRRPQLREALESLSTVDANLLGLVLNNISRRDGNAYVYDLRPQLRWDDTAERRDDVEKRVQPASTSQH